MSHILASPRRSLGDHLREWRRRRRLSQLDFALEAEISQKHLSFIESGRASASREMVLRLADRLQAPLRERNAMLLAAGYAPAFPERSLDDPALAPARAAIELILKGHEPFPALAVDRRWRLVAANAALGRLLSLVADASLLEPPVDVLRLSLAPGGFAPFIDNLPEWRAHLFERLRQQIAATGDAELRILLDELAELPTPAGLAHAAPRGAVGGADFGGVAVALRLKTPAGPLALISTTTVFGSPADVLVSEIALECFYPLDEDTAALLRAMAERAPA
jgi:transcriptional regulator with XRE-family HTH domain